eukprot:281298-Pyramimonas_sp.AAC.1
MVTGTDGPKWPRAAGQLECFWEAGWALASLDPAQVGSRGCLRRTCNNTASEAPCFPDRSNLQ